MTVLIESDWNLKDVDCIILYRCSGVLIESDWNLKSLCTSMYLFEFLRVLIESDWNLKEHLQAFPPCPENRINRIRLEFKGKQA